MPFETAYGISHRRFPHLQDHEKSKIIANLALFGRPIEERIVTVRCINKLILLSTDFILVQWVVKALRQRAVIVLRLNVGR
jgi:hypothetical protein